jgi:hypothetical protein
MLMIGSGSRRFERFILWMNNDTALVAQASKNYLAILHERYREQQGIFHDYSRGSRK